MDANLVRTVVLFYHNAFVRNERHFRQSDRPDKSVRRTRILYDVFFSREFCTARFKRGCKFRFVYVEVAADCDCKKTFRIIFVSAFVFFALERGSSGRIRQIERGIIYFVDEHFDKLRSAHFEKRFHLGNGFDSGTRNFFDRFVCRNLHLACSVESGIGFARSFFDVRRVAARGTEHERIVADRTFDHKLFRPVSAHRARIGSHGNHVDAHAFENTAVCARTFFVAFVERTGIRIERIRIHHDKFAAPHDTVARPDFVAVFRIDLIDKDRQLFIRGKAVAHESRKRFFRSRAHDHILSASRFGAQHFRSHRLPSPALFPQIARLNDRRFYFKDARGIELFADNRFRFSQRTQTERHIRVQSVCQFSDKACAHHKLVAFDDGIRRRIPQRRNNRLRSFHSVLL